MTKEQYEQMLPGARLWTGDMEVEMDAIEQIRNVTQLPILAAIAAWANSKAETTNSGQSHCLIACIFFSRPFGICHTVFPV